MTPKELIAHHERAIQILEGLIQLDKYSKQYLQSANKYRDWSSKLDKYYMHKLDISQRAMARLRIIYAKHMAK